MELGRVGAFVFMDAMSAQESIAFWSESREVASRSFWSTRAWGRAVCAWDSTAGNTDSWSLRNWDLNIGLS